MALLHVYCMCFSKADLAFFGGFFHVCMWIKCDFFYDFLICCVFSSAFFCKSLVFVSHSVFCMLFPSSLMEEKLKMVI